MDSYSKIIHVARGLKNFDSIPYYDVERVSKVVEIVTQSKTPLILYLKKFNLIWYKSKQYMFHVFNLLNTLNAQKVAYMAHHTRYSTIDILDSSRCKLYVIKWAIDCRRILAVRN